MLNAAISDLLAEKNSAAKEDNLLATNLSDRLSQELIIALVGPVGSGVSTAAEIIRNTLINSYNYDVPEIIMLSDLIRKEAYRVNVNIPPKAKLDRYVSAMQTAGNELREKFGPNYLAEKAVEKIVRHRDEAKGYQKIDEVRIHVPGRRAYIIDSIKNIEEYNLLKQIYRDTLIMIGIFAPDNLRKERLINDGAEKSSVNIITDRDQGDVPTFGQMTRKTFVEADFFICNDKKKEDLRRSLERYLEIIFDTRVHTPSRAEAAMYKADAAASNSACMSRQVGAAIISATGELIAVGWNDVPKFGGGLYNEDDQTVFDKEKNAILDKDRRCFKYKGDICHNETKRIKIIEKISDLIMKAGLLKKGKKEQEIRDIISGTEVDSIIEYSRSIHAEMEAILSIAREGKHSIVGATLYTNTYPCHNCARHIVAAGIKEVIYIQPYLKSLAIELHGDAISETSEEGDKVIFRQYDGVAPRNVLKLFKPASERKRQGKLYRVEPKKAVPVFRVPLDGFHEYENKVIAELTVKEQASS